MLLCVIREASHDIPHELEALSAQLGKEGHYEICGSGVVEDPQSNLQDRLETCQEEEQLNVKKGGFQSYQL